MIFHFILEKKKIFFRVLLVTLVLFLTIDIILTKSLKLRGFSKFYVSNEQVGFMHKPNFSGKFGGPLYDFYSTVNIGPLGERISIKNKCFNTKKILFLGDSSVAGFEVDDEKTFVSLINKNCKVNKLSGNNFGVRGYDTNQVIANYKRIRKKIEHDYVFYLIHQNDINENDKLYYYPNLVKKFGRAYNEKIYFPELSLVEKYYFKLRVFVADNFSFTTKTIVHLKDLKNFLIKSSYNFKQKNEIYHSNKKIIDYDKLNKTIILIKRLNTLVVENNKKLIIGFYPCLFEKCDYEIALEIFLSNEINNNYSNIKFIPLVSQFENLSKKLKIKKIDMRFKSDSHLSEFGHSIVYKLLVKNIKN